jgi:hypothetical protein
MSNDLGIDALLYLIVRLAVNGEEVPAGEIYQLDSETQSFFCVWVLALLIYDERPEKMLFQVGGKNLVSQVFLHKTTPSPGGRGLGEGES